MSRVIIDNNKQNIQNPSVIMDVFDENVVVSFPTRVILFVFGGSYVVI